MYNIAYPSLSLNSSSFASSLSKSNGSPVTDSYILIISSQVDSKWVVASNEEDT